jgi:WD40 repeat protein
VRPMRPRTAALLLRMPLGQGSRLRHQALETVLRTANTDVPAAKRAVARALESLGPEAVWRAWLEPSVSGASLGRWASPDLLELLERTAPVPDLAVDIAWRDWLAEHDAALWSLLERWGRAAADSAPQARVLSRLALGDDGVPLEPRLLADAAARFDHPIGERARSRLLARGDAEAVDLFCAAAVDSPDTTAFCITHHLAPSDEVRRAAFFVRTGQHEQYRALDPDGALLALGYRSASSGERSSLREAMTALGGIDTLRVLAGQRPERDDFTSLTDSERAYLVRHLTDRRDWDRLWPLTVLMPLTEAVDTVRAFGDWRPSDEDDRRVFEALRSADPRAVRACVAALCAAPASWRTPHTRIRLADLDARAPSAFDLDFSPDGTQIAFSGPSVDGFAGIIDLGGRTLSRLYSGGRMGMVLGIAHLGSDSILVENEKLGSSFQQWGIHYADHTGVRALGLETAAIRGVERIAGDRAFMVLSARDHGNGDGNKEFTNFTVLLGEGDGPLLDSGVLDGLRHEFLRATVDPEGRLIGVIGRNAIVVADLTGSVVNVLDNAPPPPEGSSLHAALSPSVLVRGDSAGETHVWYDPLTTTEPPVSRRVWSQQTFLVHLAWSAALNRFLAIGLDSDRGSDLWLLDVPATRDIPLPDDLVSERIALAHSDYRRVRLSPKGDVLAVGGPDHTIDLYALTTLTLRPVIAGPMGLMGHEELADVVAVLRNPALDEESRQALVLLRACLEYRFRHDVGIGDVAEAMAVADDDIALGG